MGVRILSGTADGDTPAAALYDSVTGAMLGQIFEHGDCYDRAEAFAQWFHTPEHETEAEHLGLSPEKARQNDARVWGAVELERLYVRWVELHVEDGMLRQPEASSA